MVTIALTPDYDSITSPKSCETLDLALRMHVRASTALLPEQGMQANECGGMTVPSAIFAQASAPCRACKQAAER